MKWQQLIVEIYSRLSQTLDKALYNISNADLNKQPCPDCNSIGWITWHLTRVQDRAIADFMAKDQLWIKDGWYLKFDRPPDPQDFGFRHTSEDIAAFKSPDVQILLGYYNAVSEQTVNYISSMSENDLNKKLKHPVFPTLGARLVGITNDNLQHAGQVAYLRGLLKGKGWLDE